MVLEISADTLVLDNAIDSRGFEDLGITNAGQLEKLWALDNSSAQYHFAGGVNAVLLTVVDEFHSLGRRAIKYNPRHLCFGQDFEVGSMEVGP